MKGFGNQFINFLATWKRSLYLCVVFNAENKPFKKLRGCKNIRQILH